jgi:hypothetical protein
MKNKGSLFAAIVSILFCSACQKLPVKICCGANLPDASIYHNWNIASDSTYTGVGATNHAVDYAGKPGDYFNVMTNGVIYMKENGVADTLSYTSLTDSTIVIAAFGITLNGVPPISKYSFTASTMRIASPIYATPGGIFGRKLNLYR